MNSVPIRIDNQYNLHAMYIIISVLFCRFYLDFE